MIRERNTGGRFKNSGSYSEMHVLIPQDLFSEDPWGNLYEPGNPNKVHSTVEPYLGVPEGSFILNVDEYRYYSEWDKYEVEILHRCSGGCDGCEMRRMFCRASDRHLKCDGQNSGLHYVRVDYESFKDAEQAVSYIREVLHSHNGVAIHSHNTI